MFKRILVYLDGSKLAEGIIPYVVEQAKGFNSKVFLLKVNTVSSLIPFYAAMPGMGTGGLAANWPLELEEPDTKSYLSNIARELSDLGLNVETIVLSGDIIDIVSKFIKDNTIDLIAISSCAYKGWKRILWGNIAQNIIRTCNIPAMVLNPGRKPLEAIDW